MRYPRETSMSLNNAPSKVEVMGWNPQSLADYMRRLRLSGCDKFVIKGSITGAQFMQMTAHELQGFPSLYVQIITKIQSDINKGEQKRVFGHTSKAQKHPKQVFVQKEEVWDSDEFDNDSDHDYEGPHQEGGEDSDIYALNEPQTAEQRDSDKTYEENCERPSSEDIMRPPPAPRGDTLQNNPVNEPIPAERTSKLPHPRPPRMTPQRPLKALASQPNLHVDRSKKPGQCGPSQTDLTKPKGSAVKAPGSSTSEIFKPRVPRPTDVANRASKLIPLPPVPTQPAKVNNSIPGPSEGLDPSWYVGKVTRHQAEVALREVNKDGAFVVRDSSQGAVEHPYTLMLLKQGKVYNIMIRNQGNSYSLGTGLKNTKSFPGVKEMITQHTHTPLLLIDATDQSSEAQSQCCLLHPAGL
ncbi:lymphocyte cytosolic protein 2 isoform X1 [Perca fluviatilis]|uniref:lymphocyte cytosolic protein 2 isoform X1 n=2 Tax=Perca fluviatilis TaxID=8168 RepID=UPI00196529F4|nr:lymphocyte cytosolic protein 2 isoform X1 [Perca fluviatilis]